MVARVACLSPFTCERVSVALAHEGPFSVTPGTSPKSVDAFLLGSDVFAAAENRKAA